MMRKKMISLALALGMGVFLLTGCENPVRESGTAVQEQDTFSKEPEAEVDAREDAGGMEAGTGEDIRGTEAEADAGEDSGATEAGGEDLAGSGETQAESQNAGSPEITPVEAALEKPAKIGDWVEAKKRSVQDKNYHTVYFRLTGVTAGAEAQKIVDTYNAGSSAVKLTDLDKEDLEYRVVTYELFFPEDFPQADYGITDVDLDFNICNLKDAGAIAGYIGLSTVWDISDTPETFHAGDTFHEGKAVFAMVKGSSEYLFKCAYDENGTQACVYVEGQ
ncbi:MAG: hypothetical protein NC124_21025 [Clostridium sp.]|nr:hypothetical protein [Clostridium sp.]